MENKKKKYNHLRNLDKKVFKFLFDEYNKSQEENEKSNLKLTNEINSNILNLEVKLKSMKEKGLEDTLAYRRIQDEYEEALYKKSKLKLKDVNYVRSFSDEYSHIKLNPDANKFLLFLATVLKIKPEEIKKLFGEDLNLIFKAVIDEDNHFDYAGDILDEIENRYNANVNCFNITGKYIQDLDASIFDIKDKSNNILDFSEITGLYNYNDMMKVYNEDNHEIEEYPQQYEGKYSYYALFIRDDIPDDFQDRILNTLYLEKLFYRMSKKDAPNSYYHPNACHYIVKFLKENNLEIRTDRFRGAIDKISLFYVGQEEKYGTEFEYENKKYDKEYKKLVDKIKVDCCLGYEVERYEKMVENFHRLKQQGLVNFKDKDELIKEEGKGSY